MTPTQKSPAIRALDAPEVGGSGYPEPFRSRMGDRVKRRLGEAFGLTQFGVNLVTLGPGGQSALRHWHTKEEELMYLLSGTLVLITNTGETVLQAGDCAGYAAGKNDAHHLVNRSEWPATYLEIGSRFDDDVAFYPDDDLMWVSEQPETAIKNVAAHKDGTLY